jgi:hypothetical protein
MSVDPAPKPSTFLRIGIADDLLVCKELGRVRWEDVWIDLISLDLDRERFEIRIGEMANVEDAEVLIVAGGADEIRMGG